MPSILPSRVRDVWLQCSQAWTGYPISRFRKIASNHSKEFTRAAELITDSKAMTRDWVTAQIFYRNRPNYGSTVSPAVLCDKKARARYETFLEKRNSGVDHKETLMGTDNYRDVVWFRVEMDLDLLDDVLVSRDPAYVDMVVTTNIHEFSAFLLAAWTKIYPDTLLLCPQLSDDVSGNIKSAVFWMESFSLFNDVCCYVQKRVSGCE